MIKVQKYDSNGKADKVCLSDNKRWEKTVTF